MAGDREFGHHFGRGQLLRASAEPVSAMAGADPGGVAEEGVEVGQAARQEAFPQGGPARNPCESLYCQRDCRCCRTHRSGGRPGGTQGHPRVGTALPAPAGHPLVLVFHQLGQFISCRARPVGVPCLEVDPACTSQMCPNPWCGHVEQGNRPDRGTFDCRRCGFAGPADQVAGVNVARRAPRRGYSSTCPYSTPPSGAC